MLRPMALFTRGNRLVITDDGGTESPVRLWGVSLQDPLWQRLAPGPRMLAHGPIGLEAAASWSINTIRVPFHPVTIRHAGRGDWDRGLTEVQRELEWIFLAAKALDLFVLIDFHSIGFPAQGWTFDFSEAPFENIYAVRQDETESFWRVVAAAYGRHPRLAGFEIFNEATNESKFASAEDWSIHSRWAEQLIVDCIRPDAPEALVIVGGLHFGYDLEFVGTRPVADRNVAYSSHPYPHHSQAKTWDRAFGKTSEHFPVLLTEVGFSMTPPNAAPGQTLGFFDREHHRGYRDWELELQTYADRRSLSVIAWNFSASWEPALLKNNADLEANEAGVFFRTWFQALANSAKAQSLTAAAPEDSGSPAQADVR